MDKKRFRWSDVIDTYSTGQVSSVIKALGMKIKGETYDEYQTLCPFHANLDTPAFSISKRSGAYNCFSPECAKSGNLTELVMSLTKRNQFEAMRFILKYQASDDYSLTAELEQIFSDEPEVKPFSQDTLDRLRNQFWETSPGQEYMAGRGFEEETLRHFDIGYSPKVKRGNQTYRAVTVPVHTPQGIPMGMVARSIEGKDFINSPGLLKSKTLWNSHRAKKAGGTAIVCESSFDVMKIHQAGYPQGVALLGNMSADQKYYLNRFFDRIIIMTDFDDKEKHKKDGYCAKCYPEDCRGHNPGRDLGTKISAIQNKEILWASYGFKQVYARGVKDATDMTTEEIRQCIENAVPDIEYVSWGLY
jgi:DNA primase